MRQLMRHTNRHIEMPMFKPNYVNNIINVNSFQPFQPFNSHNGIRLFLIQNNTKSTYGIAAAWPVPMKLKRKHNHLAAIPIRMQTIFILGEEWCSWFKSITFIESQESHPINAVLCFCPKASLFFFFLFAGALPSKTLLN